MEIEVPVYPYSQTEANRLGEIKLWRDSYRANIGCKEAIEQSIRASFDGMHLNEDCVDTVIERFGYKRTTFVLANTLKEKDFDGRFHEQNKEWAKQFYIPPDRNHNCSFTVESHPAVLDGFISLYRQRLDALDMFNSQHCIPDSRAALDYQGKVLVMSTDTLRETYWEPKYQLWYAHDGFGCSPKSLGRSIRATCLADGECVRWNRSEFIGVIQDKYLPDWAREQAERLQSGQEIYPLDAQFEQVMS